MTWETIPLGKVATIERNSVTPQSLPGDTAYLGLEHIARGGAIIGSSTVAEAELASAKFKFGPEHVLFGKLRPNLGKISRPTFEGICSTDIFPLMAGSRLDRNYLAHYLSQPSMIEYASTRAAGANLPRLSATMLSSFKIPLPALEEQRRIAAILDQSDEIRANRRAQLKLLDELPQSLFHEMFGTALEKPIPLKDLAVVSSGITKGRRTTAPTISTPYLAVANVQAGHLKLHEVKQIEATETEIARFSLQDGDIVMTEGGDPDKLGRGTVWRGELEVCLHQNHIFRVRFAPTSRVLPDYFAAALQRSETRQYFLRLAKQTTGIASINMTQLRAFPVQVPPLDKQHEFLKKIVAIRVERDRVARALEADEELFAALQYRAFRGEL